MTNKQKIYKYYLQLVNDKVSRLQQVLADLKESGSNETKSTAGDKHETALAMLQIEQANTRGQLNDALALSASVIVNGSLVKTNLGYLFVSVALGKTVIENMVVIALSPKSPLGQKLMGLSVSGVAEINGNKYIIESIE
jgi:hypothetical protein